MSTRQERRAAELAAKKMAKKAGVPFDPAPYKVAAPRAVDVDLGSGPGTIVFGSEEGLEPDEEVQIDAVCRETAEWVGIDVADQRIGDGGTITAEWKARIGGLVHYHQVGNFWSRAYPNIFPNEYSSLEEAQKVARRKGAQKMVSPNELIDS